MNRAGKEGADKDKYSVPDWHRQTGNGNIMGECGLVLISGANANHLSTPNTEGGKDFLKVMTFSIE